MYVVGEGLGRVGGGLGWMVSLGGENRGGDVGLTHQCDYLCPVGQTACAQCDQEICSEVSSFLHYFEDFAPQRVWLETDSRSDDSVAKCGL